jgi:hypothetical protein
LRMVLRVIGTVILVDAFTSGRLEGERRREA